MGSASHILQKPWVDLRHFLNETTLSSLRVFEQSVVSIAHYFHADVCTLYGFDRKFLVLLATKGLYPESRFKTRMALGQGIVGEVAKRLKPISLVNVRTSHVYEYFPEIGEENYRSFLAVPILKNDTLLGVLTIQTVQERFFAPHEIHDLELFADALGDYLAAHIRDIFFQEASKNTLLRSEKTVVLSGVTLHSGFVEGRAVIHKSPNILENLSCEKPSFEKKKLAKALKKMYGELENLIASHQGTESEKQILESYRALSEDEAWIESLHKGIDSGLSLEGALQKSLALYSEELKASKNPYFMNRISDIEDLTNRLMSYVILQQKPYRSDMAKVDLASEKTPVIVVAHRLGPIELLEYYHHGLSGLILEEAQETSHAAILAKSLGIPVIANLTTATDTIHDQDVVFMDGERSLVWVRPDSEASKDFREKREHKNKVYRLYEQIRHAPAMTQDGVSIHVMINAALQAEFAHIDQVDGIGLYRSEIPFMLYPDFPDVKVQKAIYSELFDTLREKPLYFRLLDVGGDKPLPTLANVFEPNPNMGWRSIRLSLDMPMILRHQVRALIQAANGRAVTILVPMVAEISEYLAVFKIIEMEKRNAKVPVNIRMGVVVEVPSLSWELERLLPHLDCIAIGSNDLFQFFYASDRTNHNLRGRYDCLSSSFLRYLKHHIDLANRAGVELNVCGEMASNPLEALVLLGLGVRRLSVTPAAIPEVKLMLRSLELKPFSDYVGYLLAQNNDNIRYSIQSYAKDHEIIIE